MEIVNKKKELVYALVGNPNSGKTTLFNQLTGLKQKVANYPGVTVEKKEGCFCSQHGKKVRLIDLPGAYSLSAHSPDEEILQKVLLGKMEGVDKPDRVICVIDASNLERTLYLAVQVMELGVPTLLVLNMMDTVERRGLSVNVEKLEEMLGMKVVPTQANKKEGVLHLKVAMSQAVLPEPRGITLNLAGKLKEAVVRIQSGLAEGSSFGEALLLLAGHGEAEEESKAMLEEWRELLDTEEPQWRSEIIEARYQVVEALHKEVVHEKTERKLSNSEKIDKVILHKVWGWGVLALVMGSLFWGLFSVSEYPMEWIANGVDVLKGFVGGVLPEGPLRGLVVDGVITGVGSVLAFLPQIMMLFFFIGVLETTGYLPRAAFLLDKVMSKVGLHGKSFVPLLSSYACAIPGIMATRTLGSKQERLATIMIAPWMSCSARLPVYLMMIGILVPNSAWMKTLVMMGIYLVGTLAALGTAWVFRKTLLKGRCSTSAMELPHYRVPCLRNIVTEMVQRTMMFVRRAGKIILAFSVIIWFMMAYPQAGLDESLQLEESYMGTVGKVIEPLIAPLGYDWKVGVGLLGSFAARELFVSTMAIINKGAEVMYSPLTCVSLIVFFIFAMQCMSTLAVVKKETNSWKWPLFQLVYMTGFAYMAALVVYQGGRLLGFN